MIEKGEGELEEVAEGSQQSERSLMKKKGHRKAPEMGEIVN